MVSQVQGAFKCQVRDPEDCTKVRQFLEVCCEEVGTSLFPILSTVKLLFKRCMQQGRVAVVGTHAGAPAAVIFNTGLKSSGGEHTGAVFAVVAVTFVAPGPGEPFGAAEAFVTFRRQAELPRALVSSDLASAASLPSRSVALYNPNMPAVAAESFGWKLLNPQNPTGVGASGCDNDLVCPDGVRGVADTPTDEYWNEIIEATPVRTGAPGELADLSCEERAVIEAARRACASQTILAVGGIPSSSFGGDNGIGPDLVPETMLPMGLAKNSRLMRLPKGVWDGQAAGDVVATLNRAAAESFEFAAANPAAVVTIYNIEHNLPLMVCPFICRLGPSQTPKMCAAMLFGEFPAEPGVYKALTVLPLHQAYPLARILGPLERPAHSWLHSSPRTPWCNASDFDGKFRLEQWEVKQAQAEHAMEVEKRQANISDTLAATDASAGAASHEASALKSLTIESVELSRVSGLTISTGSSTPPEAEAATPPSPMSELGLPDVVGVASSFSLGASTSLEDVIRGAPVMLDLHADSVSLRDAPAVAGRSGTGTHEMGLSGPFSPEKWDSRIPRGLFLPFVPFPVANEEAVTRIFSKWAPILSVSVWSASSGRRINAAIRFASQSAKSVTDTAIQKAAWDVRHHGESRYQFVDDDDTERFLWVRPLENREPRGGSTRHAADAPAGHVPADLGSHLPDDSKSGRGHLVSDSAEFLHPHPHRPQQQQHRFHHGSGVGGRRSNGDGRLGGNGFAPGFGSGGPLYHGYGHHPTSRLVGGRGDFRGGPTPHIGYGDLHAFKFLPTFPHDHSMPGFSREDHLPALFGFHGTPTGHDAQQFLTPPDHSSSAAFATTNPNTVANPGYFLPGQGRAYQPYGVAALSGHHAMMAQPNGFGPIQGSMLPGGWHQNAIEATAPATASNAALATHWSVRNDATASFSPLSHARPTPPAAEAAAAVWDVRSPEFIAAYDGMRSSAPASGVAGFH